MDALFLVECEDNNFFRTVIRPINGKLALAC